MTRKRDANRGGPVDYRQMADSRVEQLRIPPQSIDAECAVIGGLMLAPDAWPKIADKLSEADFYRRDHQLIYRAIAEMAEADPPKPYDAVTLGEWFESQGMAEAVADGYLIGLAANTPSAANITAYAEIVRDKAILRQLIEEGTSVVNDAFQPEGRDPEALLDAAQARFMAMSMRNDSGGLKLMSGHVGRMYAGVTEEATNKVKPEAFTPWNEVNAIIRRARPGDLIVLAARPSVGKTVVGVQVGLHNAMQNKKAVGIFSLEMSAEDLTRRMVANIGLIDGDRLESPCDMDDRDWARLSAASRELKALPIAIDDSGGIGIREIRARALRMHQKIKGGLGLLAIDYFQLISTAGHERRLDGLTEASRGLKELAKQLGIPLLVLAQINRESAKEARRPTMADLRECGALEQDADTVVLLHRVGRHLEFIVDKQRRGKTGTAKLSPELQFYRFKSYDPLDEPPEDDRPAPRKPRSYGVDTASARAGDDR